MSQDRKKIMLMGLYEHRDRNGNQFFTGRLGMSDVMIFKNTKKSSEKSPDYWVYVAEKPQDPKPPIHSSEDEGFPF